jgi:acyl carrier protein
MLQLKRKKSDTSVSEKNDEQLYDEILSVISLVTKINAANITVNTLIREELNIDSLMAMEILSRLEIKYGIKIKEEEAIKKSNIGDFIKMINLIINKKRKI